jgi:UDP-glucose 4-epimerase
VRTYLVTGGAGFIGSHLVRALLEQGNKVRVLDNFSTGKPENLQGLDGSLEVVEGDLRDAARVSEAVRGTEVIFHEAAYVSVPHSMAEPQACFDVNLTGTSILLDEARKAGARRVVIASSAAVYGESTALPLSESANLKPLSPYALSKQMDELFAKLFTDVYRLESVALRYFNVYGARQRPDSMYAAAVPIFFRQLSQGEPVQVFGDGSQTRDLIHVHDVIAANLVAADHPSAPGEVFNICTGIETRLLDLLEVMYDLFPNSKPPLFTDPRPGDIHRSVGDASKAKQQMDFTARVSLQEGLKETFEWNRA